MFYSEEKLIYLSKYFHKNSSHMNNNYFDFQNICKERKQFISLIFLIFKSCFFLLALVSLFKIGHTSKLRIIRLKEIKNSYFYEINRYEDLNKRFDDLFSFEGEQRFMKDQDQMISRDLLRVIWR